LTLTIAYDFDGHFPSVLYRMPTVIAALSNAPTDHAPASKDDSFSYVHGPVIDDHRSRGQLGGDCHRQPAGRDERERASQWITELGLYDYRNRVYSAELGRFLQTDPIQFDAGDVNLYRYVKNYVTRLIDPFGLTSGYDDDWQGSGGTRPDTDEGLPNASIPWSPDHPNPPANADPCCSKSACRAACYAFIGASQTACSKIPAVGGWGFAAQATCRAVAAAAGMACLQSCEKCTKP
jgi:RHS repeat-associated protein